jgi:hypothetical protein
MRACLLLICAAAAAGELRLLEIRKIWDQAPHNAFTDLVRFRGDWYCAFREGERHVSPDGAIRILRSRDGKRWESAARLTLPAADLRDAKLHVTPNGRLVAVAAGALDQPAAHRHQTYAWATRDGKRYDAPVPIGEPDFWLWRVVWLGRTAYGVGYHTAGENVVRLYESSDGLKFTPLVARLFDQGFPNESALARLPDGTLMCLLRRDREPASAQLGRSKPPYTEWQWTDLGVRVGGPQMVRLSDGRLVAGVRLYDGAQRTSLCLLDAAEGKLAEALKLPSAGDTSYPGMVEHNGELWVSYYSSHEGKTSIYLARIGL